MENITEIMAGVNTETTSMEEITTGGNILTAHISGFPKFPLTNLDTTRLGSELMHGTLSSESATSAVIIDTATESARTLHEAGELMTFAAVAIILFIIIGISGNLLTIIALVRYPRVRSATAVFIISLSVADLLFCAINMPFSASRFIHRKWIYSETWCILFPFLRYVNVGLSLLSITAITINRYILIAHQSLYEKIYKKRYIALMTVSIWIFSFVMLIPTLLGKWGRFGYDPQILNCSILEVDGRSSKTFLFVFGFLIPCFAIVVGYARIFCVVRQSSKRIRKHSFSNGTDKADCRVHKDAGLKRKREEWRITKMVLIIFCSFFICYLPITILKVLDQRLRYPSLNVIAYILIYMSACINPIIYGLTNKQYRQAYKSVLIWWRPRFLSISSSSGSGSAQHTPNGSLVNRTVVSVVTPLADDNVFEDKV